MGTPEILELAIQSFFAEHHLDLPDIDCQRNSEESLKACQACEKVIAEGRSFVSEKENLPNKVTNSLIIFLAVNLRKDRWNNTEIVRQAIEIYSIVDDVYHIQSYLVSSGPMALSKQIHDLMQNHLTKADWQHNALTMGLYSWYCYQLKFPVMSERLNYTLPPALLLLDSHDNSLKLTGLKAIKYILSQSGKTEMRWQGRVNVIYDAIQRLTYVHVQDILNEAYLTMVEIFEILKSSTNEKEMAYRDEIYRRLLADMYQEDVIRMRQMYASILHEYIVRFGPDNLKHLSTISRVIFSYLIYKNEDTETTRQKMLQTLIALMEACPSGMKLYHVPTLQATLRCFVDTASLKWQAKELYQSVLTICRLVKLHSPDLVTVTLKDIAGQEDESCQVFSKIYKDLISS